MTRPRQVTISAPAKLNLGLEIRGKRPDGFHELVTIFQTVSLADELTLTATADGSLSLVCDNPALAGDANLALAALARLRAVAGIAAGARLTLRKRIPVAAGLGGASADAAAALRAGCLLWEAPLDDAALHELAAGLGSDVPFLLTGGTALGTGRGEELTRLPPLPPVWFVLVSPDIQIPRKTPALYGALIPADFSDGATVSALAAAIRTGDVPLPLAPPNAFRRALYAIEPSLATMPAAILAAGAAGEGISGAGPTHFGICPDEPSARAVVAALRRVLPPSTMITIATPLPAAPRPCLEAQTG